MLSLFTLGVLTMPATADPQPKWTEKVTVKRYVGDKDLDFAKPHENIDAYRKTIEGADAIVLRGAGKGGTPGGKPRPKTEITTSDGDVYRVTKPGGGNTDYICYVTKITKPE